MLMNNVVNEAGSGGTTATTAREDGVKNRDPLVSLVFTWFTRAIFTWLVLWGFLVYLRYEWMMW